MFAATAAGVYNTVSEAMRQMGQGFDKTYLPEPERAALYTDIYRQYCKWGALVEQHSTA